MDPPVLPGDVLLGKYQIERVLGQGGMGVVVAARHVELGELFAIKFLLPEALASPQAVDRFLREARAAARLKGEHVARVHDVGRLESGAPYMVMEHLVGSDLKALVRTRGPLPVEEAVAYVLQACEAISEAHALGIVHRDIKPANLFLVHRPNGTPCVKVLDFGISKQVTPGSVDLTQTGAMLGSPLYMSPEQMLRTKNADARSDIWAMGVVLYELVTGTVPFLAGTLPEVVGRVLQEEPLLPSQRRSGLPAALDAVVARCLQKRSEQRFQNMDELSAALQGLPSTSSAAWVASSAVSQAGATAVLAETPARVGQTRGRLEQLLPGSGATEPASTGMTGGAWGQTSSEGRAPRARGTAAVIGAVFSVAVIGSVIAWLALRGSSVPGTVPDAAAVAAAPIQPLSTAGAVDSSALAHVAAPPSTGTEPAAIPVDAAPQVSTASVATDKPPTTNLPDGVPGSATTVRPGSKAPVPPVLPAVKPTASSPSATQKKYEGVF